MLSILYAIRLIYQEQHLVSQHSTLERSVSEGKTCVMASFVMSETDRSLRRMLSDSRNSIQLWLRRWYHGMKQVIGFVSDVHPLDASIPSTAMNECLISTLQCEGVSRQECKGMGMPWHMPLGMRMPLSDSTVVNLGLGKYCSLTIDPDCAIRKHANLPFGSGNSERDHSLLRFELKLPCMSRKLSPIGGNVWLPPKTLWWRAVG